MTIQCTHFEITTSHERSLLQDAGIVLGASVLIGLFASISIPLPFTPVPIAMQAQVILFLAAMLGSKRGALAVLAYLAQGLMGLPVFAGNTSGVLVLAGPTGGYLLGYLAGAYATGYLAERLSKRTPARAFGAMALGNLVVFAFGVSWLSQFVGWQGALMLGFVPFVIGDLLKLTLAARSLKAFRFFK